MLTLRRLFRLTRLDREEGQAIPFFAIASIALLLMTGFVIDSGNLFQNRQSLQNAADASAIAAAQFVAAPEASCQGTTSIGACAGVYAGLNGSTMPNGNVTALLTPCPNDGTVTDTKPPPTGPGCYVYPYTVNGNNGNVEVWLTQQTTNFFGGILGIGKSTESARAIGTLIGGNPPQITFGSLDDTCENHTLLIKLGGNLVVKNGIYVNSCSQGDGFDIFGGGSISAPKIETVGGWETHNASKVCGSSSVLCVPANVCSFPRNSGGTDWHITPTTVGYTPTKPGCPDVGQAKIGDPFAAFPPAPTLGPGNVGSPFTITKVSRGLNGDAANVARVVTASAHGFAVGNKVTVSGVGSFGGGNFDGTYTVASVPNATTFTYANTGSNVPVITQKRLSGGVATMTTNAPTTLTIGEHDLSVLGIPGFNVNPPGAPATVTGTGPSSFSYQPPPFTFSIGKKQLQSSKATLTLSSGSTAGLDPGDTLTVNIGDARFDGSRTVATVPNGTTFTYADSATTTLTVTQKAAAHGVATLTAANNLSVGDTVTVNIGDARFNGTYTVSAASATQFSYAGSNLGTMTISPTARVMAAGVATLTVANHLANGENVTSNLADVNYAGGPYAVSGVTATTFKYTPAVSVSVTSGSITNKVAKVNTSVNHFLTPGDDVKVSGDEAYTFTGNAANVGVVDANTFTYTPAPIANVTWNVTSTTHATLTTPGTHDTNITSITITGTGAKYLDTKTFSGGNLTVTSNGFAITGSGFTTGNHGAAATVTVNTAGSATFSGALATHETAWDLASKAASGTVTVPYFLAATGASGTVTAPAFVAANTAASGSATVTNVPLLAASGTLLPAWMPPLFGVAAKNLPGSPGIPSTTVISSGTVTLDPGTYYGGICIGAAAGANCVGANCKAAVGTTTTSQPYVPAVHLNADVTGDDASPTYNKVIVDTAAPITVGDLIAVDDEDMTVTAITGTTLTVTREANGTEDAAHTNGTQVFHVVTTPNGAAYNPVEKLNNNSPNPVSAAATSFIVQASANPGVNGIKAGDVIQVGGEAILVGAVSAYDAQKRATLSGLTRGYYFTTATTHSNGDQVYRVTAAGTPAPPTVTLTKGVYIMAGGGFSVCGAANVNAPNGVMIYNTQDPPPNNTGVGLLGQVDINTSGSVHLHAMTSGVYKGMTIFQDRALSLFPGAACGGKGSDTNSSQWDIAFQSAAPLPLSGEPGSITGTIYASGFRADFGDTMSGTTVLAVITSCIYINGANSTFNFDPDLLAGASATLGG